MKDIKPSFLLRFAAVLLLFAAGMGSAKAAVHVYSGPYAYSSEIMYTWDGEHLYSGA